MAVHERILTTAFRHFVERGFGDAAIDRIALAADVSRTTIYNKFRDKSDLLQAACMPVLRRLQAGAAIHIESGEPGEMIAGFVDDAQCFLASDLHLEFLQLLVGSRQAQPWLAENYEGMVRAQLRGSLDRLLGLLSVTTAAGPEVVESLSSHLLALLDGAVTLPRLRGQAVTTRTLEAAFAALIHSAASS